METVLLSKVTTFNPGNSKDKGIEIVVYDLNHIVLYYCVMNHKYVKNVMKEDLFLRLFKESSTLKWEFSTILKTIR